MALHNELGRHGEQLAAQYLSSQGYTVLHKNWRHFRHEIDLIAIKDEVLHFIEVKTRQSTKFGMPEDDVNPKKMHCLIQAGEAFLLKHRQWKRVQFDVLSISINGGKAEYFFIEDVYI